MKQILPLIIWLSLYLVADLRISLQINATGKAGKLDLALKIVVGVLAAGTLIGILAAK